MLTIKNIQTIIGETYNEVFNIIGVKEHTHHYEFTLGYATVGKPNYETILLHREQTDNGMYVMEYKRKTLWLNTNEFDTIDKIIICMQTI
jgi:predicted NodU family carbamoyl transferase